MIRYHYQGWRDTDIGQVLAVTEWRNGCVFKTRRIGYARKSDVPKHPDALFSSVSTSFSLHGGMIDLLDADDLKKVFR